MKYLQEITDSEIRNHTYYVSDDKSKLVGYIKSGTNSVFKFQSPLRFDSRGRKFVEVNISQKESDEVYFGKQNKTTEKNHTVIEIKGSTGKVYYLTKFKDNTMSCSCPGFMFRRTCKHISEYK